MKFQSDTVRMFRKYAAENLSAEELEESRRLVRSRKSRHDSDSQELSESQQKRKGEMLDSILERHRGSGLQIEIDRQPAASDLRRPAVQFPAKLCS